MISDQEKISLKSDANLEDAEDADFLNFLSWMCFLVCMTYGAAIFVSLNLAYALPSLIASLFFLASAVLNKMGSRMVAKQLFLFSANAVTYVSSDLFGSAAQLYLYLVIIGFAPIPILGLEHRGFCFFWALVSFALLIASGWTDNGIFQNPKELDSIVVFLAHSSRLGTFLIALLSILVLERSNDRLISALKRREGIIQEQQVKIISSAKFSSLGEMAAGVAHEINNPLTIIKGKASRLGRMAEAGHVNPELLVEDLGKIRVTVDRIAKIVQGLLWFSREGKDDPLCSHDLLQLLFDTLELCRERLVHHGIEIRFSHLENLEIECRASQISQIIMSLIQNSFDAVTVLPERWVEIGLERCGDTARLTVTDSGHGIPSQIADKVMQPFFTTKPVGKGVGLGLSVSKGLAEGHGGSLYYDSGYHHTRFVLELGLAAAA